DLGMHRLKGVGEEQIWQVHSPGLRVEFPPIRTLQPERHNLPLPPGPYLGRDADINQWLELLRRPNVRLPPLVGAGGMGKSRSALHLAELLADDFRDGVWFVPLEETSSAEGMIQRIANELRLAFKATSPDAGRAADPVPAAEQLRNYLRDREL